MYNASVGERLSHRPFKPEIASPNLAGGTSLVLLCPTLDITGHKEFS